MPQAPETYRPPSAGNIEQLNAEAKKGQKGGNGLYQSYRYIKFRERQKKKQRAIDEERVHKIYQQLEERSFKDYMLWLEDDNPLCVDCLDEGLIKPGRVMDHIEPIEEGGLIYDSNNLQFMCDFHHNKKRGRESRSDKSKVRIISGAPGSGKTTYVRNHVKPGDLVFDLDEIYKALSFQPIYKKPEELKDVVFRVRDRVYRAIREVNDIKRAWVVVSYPDKKRRLKLERELKGDLYLIQCSRAECKERIRKQDRAGSTNWSSVVDDWFNKFEQVEGERVINYG